MTAVQRMTTSAKGVDMIHSFEGLRLDAYRCPAGIWTIGWGATTDEQGRPIKPGDKWTRQRADQRFRQHLARFEADVNRLIGQTKTTQGQFDALVSFAYNLGPASLGKSTLLKLHNAGDHDGAAAQFARWNRAGGRVLAGLTRRRNAEAALYRGEA